MKQFPAIAKSMEEIGFLRTHPIVMFEGMVLDGWHRYQAALIAGVKPIFTEFEGTAEDAAIFIVHENGDRRHLNGSQKAAAEIVCLDRAGIKRSADDISKRSGISIGTVRTLQRREEADLQDMVDGKKTTSEVISKTKRRTGPPETFTLLKSHIVKVASISTALDRKPQQVMRDAMERGLESLKVEADAAIMSSK